MKRIILSAVSDIATDQRVKKVAASLHHAGYDVLVIGRKKRDSIEVEKSAFRIERMKLWIETGPLFYAEFNIRLFFRLLFRKADALNANDLDTLAANYLASIFKRIPVVYDSHEYFTGVPELVHRPRVRKIWKSIERFLFPRQKHVYTVNQSIADLYQEEYGVPVDVIRNLPTRSSPIHRKSRSELGLPADRFILIMQGAINVDRGAEEMIEAMRYIENGLFLIIGTGDVLPLVQEKVQGDAVLQDRVRIMGRMLWSDLMSYTAASDLGLTLEKDTNINYRFSLPNKLFDYLKAGIPALASDLVETSRIIRHYDVGSMITSHDPCDIARTINSIIGNPDQLRHWRQHTAQAAGELCWENQEEALLNVYRRALGETEL